MIIYNKQIQQSLQRANFPFSRTESGHFNVPLSKNLIKYIIKHFGTDELTTFMCNPRIEVFFMAREDINPLAYFWIMRAYGRPDDPTTLDLPHFHMVDVSTITYLANSVATLKITEQEVRKALLNIYNNARTGNYGGYLLSRSNDRFTFGLHSSTAEDLMALGSEVVMRLYLWRYLILNYTNVIAYWEDYCFVDNIMPNRLYKSLQGGAKMLQEHFSLKVAFESRPNGRPFLLV